MKSGIPLWTYLPYYRKNRRSILSVVDTVFSSGILLMGKEVAHFEKEFATFTGARFAVGVGNGTDALFLSLKALGVTAGDEVITVPNTAAATVSAIIASGATPVFVDIKSDTYLINTNALEAAITKRTKVILPVHLYGQCVDMDAVCRIAKKHNLFVLEDCAQATGSTWRGHPAGSMGTIAAFSFYPTKPLGAYGDGGMIVTSRAHLAKKIRAGNNSRLDEVHAALLHFQLQHFTTAHLQRRRLAQRYTRMLADTPLILPCVDPRGIPSWYLYVCRHPKRTALIAFLKKHGIAANIRYQHPIHEMKGFRSLGYTRGDFPIAERVSREIFSLPFYPDLSTTDQNRVIAIIKKFFQTR
jgi:aminotransferase EvaB